MRFISQLVCTGKFCASAVALRAIWVTGASSARRLGMFAAVNQYRPLAYVFSTGYVCLRSLGLESRATLDQTQDGFGGFATGSGLRVAGR